MAALKSIVSGTIDFDDLGTPTITERGFDTLTRRIQADGVFDFEALKFAYNIAQDDAHAQYTKMFVSDIDSAKIHGHWDIKVFYRGIADTDEEKRRRFVGTNVESIQADLAAGSLPAPPYPLLGGLFQVDVKEPHILVVDEYVSPTQLSTEVSGTNVDPSNAPTPPPSRWSSLTNPLYNYPYQWVLENREQDHAGPYNNGAYTYRDTFVYYYLAKPS